MQVKKTNIFTSAMSYNMQPLTHSWLDIFKE